jgi:hypothetical protein
VTETLPVVCTLTRAELRDRGAAWRKLWASGLVKRRRVRGGIRLTAEPGGVRALHELIDLERECCAWIDYAMDDTGATLTAKGAGRVALAGMFRP